MKAGVLVDTDVMADFLLGAPEAAAFFRANGDRMALSAVTVAEVFAGARAEELAALEELTEAFPVLPATGEIAREAGRLKGRDGRTHGTGLADALVAATARLHGMELATLNTRHFPMWPGLRPAFDAGGEAGCGRGMADGGRRATTPI